MCFAVYLASATEIPVRTTAEVSVERLDDIGQPVHHWRSLRNVRYVAAFDGYGCGFPSVVAEEPIEWFDEMFDDVEDRERIIASVRALTVLLKSA